MREILFRGKRTDNGEWFYGYYTNARYYLDKKEMHIIFEQDVEVYPHSEFAGGEEVIPETVGQYTGLTDKNGRKIFEGDVIEFADFFDSEIHRGVAYWCDFAFWLDCTETEGDDEGIYSLAYISSNALEVIGNIYDNPELMKGGIDNG